MAENKGLLDYRTIKGFEGANDTPWTDGLLGDNQTITGQEFSDNPVVGGMQKFNKGLLGTVLKTGEQGLNYAMGTAMAPFNFIGDTAEQVHEALPDSWANKLSDIMYNSGGSMDSDEFGDEFEGHLIEGIMAFPLFAEFRPIAMKSLQNKTPLPKIIKEKVLQKANINSSIRYTMDDVKDMFEGLNISDKTQSGIIYEYDWYTKGKKWEGDKGNLWNGIKVNAKEQSKFEAKIKEKIMKREVIIQEGETWAEQSQIKARLDTLDLNDLNKTRIEQGLTPIKETVTTIVDGKPIEAKFISGKIDGIEVGLQNNEVKRVAYILSDGIKSSHRKFDQSRYVMGLVDEYPSQTNVLREKIRILESEIRVDEASGTVALSKLDELKTLKEKGFNEMKNDLGMRQDSPINPPYSIGEAETLSHELGHIIHNKLSIKTIPEFLKNNNLELGIANKELIELSKKMRPNLWDDTMYKNKLETNPDSRSYILELMNEQSTYRMKDVELLADFIKGYLVDPKLTKRLAPNMSKILQKMVNESWFKDILKLAKADIMPKGGMLQKQEINSGLLNTTTV